MRAVDLVRTGEPGLCAEVIIVQALLKPSNDIVERPEERARTLLFAWLMSLRPGLDLKTSALELKHQLLSASPHDNPMLPHLCQLLDEVRHHAAGSRKGRGTERLHFAHA
jgi:hypothetical protein